MRDLETTQDLHHLFGEFYKKLLEDPEMHRIFLIEKNINMQQHLPHIVSFWEQIVFNTGNYNKNVMQIHMNLNALTPLKAVHFQTWLDTLFGVIDQNFKGENTEKLKTRALSIATIMQIKTNKTG
jgi:hemoglobin